MRVAFWVVATLALIVGALYGVGYFLLPNTLDVTRTIAIDRPRAAIFAMSNDLTIAKEWSPYYARDPDADYSFSGEGPGPGQTMRWASNVRDVGEGRMTIVRSTPNREIETILQLGDRATLNGRMMIEPTATGSSVAWSLSAACREGAINIPCRYMNLVLERSITKDLDAGLSRLKALAEQLPDVDFEGLASEILQVAPQPFVFVEARTTFTDSGEVQRALTMGIQQVRDYMTQTSLTPSGPLVRETRSWDQAQSVMSFRVGYPFQGAVPLTVVGAQIGETPSGRALRVLHVGPSTAMQETYMKADAYLQAHRIARREGAMPWEVVLADDAGVTGEGAARVEIYFPLQ